MGVFVVGVAGGSGAPYAARVIEGLMRGGHDVKGVFTTAGRKVFQLELGVSLDGAPDEDAAKLRAALDAESAPGSLELFDPANVAASIASGSFPVSGMAVAPCSMGTLARIAQGVSSNLLERAADVTLKERRRLVLTPRETPLSLVHLRNMTAVTEAGAVVLPAMPAFYHDPKTVQDLVDTVAGRILHHLGVDSDMLKPWRGPGNSPEAED